MIQAQICRALTQAGLEIIGSALDGKQGVEMALRERPDIVLMDLNLPIIDGMEAARRIIAAYGPCVVMVTAYGDGDLRKRAREIGVCGYIVKPFDRNNLLSPLEAAFEAHMAQTSA
jgi:response regulator NasT